MVGIEKCDIKRKIYIARYFFLKKKVNFLYKISISSNKLQLLGFTDDQEIIETLADTTNIAGVLAKEAAA